VECSPVAVELAKSELLVLMTQLASNFKQAPLIYSVYLLCLEGSRSAVGIKARRGWGEVGARFDEADQQADLRVANLFLLSRRRSPLKSH
jgi:hypothetical protein